MGTSRSKTRAKKSATLSKNPAPTADELAAIGIFLMYDHFVSVDIPGSMHYAEPSTLNVRGSYLPDRDINLQSESTNPLKHFNQSNFRQGNG